MDFAVNVWGFKTSCINTTIKLLKLILLIYNFSMPHIHTFKLESFMFLKHLPGENTRCAHVLVLEEQNIYRVGD